MIEIGVENTKRRRGSHGRKLRYSVGLLEQAPHGEVAAHRQLHLPQCLASDLRISSKAVPFEVQSQQKPIDIHHIYIVPYK